MKCPIKRANPDENIGEEKMIQDMHRMNCRQAEIIEILKKAVEFYANDSQYDAIDGINFGPLYIEEDLGDVAQQALKDIEEE